MEKKSVVSLTEFMSRMDYYINPFDTIQYYFRTIGSNLLINADLRKAVLIRIQNAFIVYYHIVFARNKVNPNMIGFTLYNKLMLFDYPSRCDFILHNIPIFSTVLQKQIPETFYTNFYSSEIFIRPTITIMDKNHMMMIYVFIINYVHLSFHVMSDILMHAVLESNISESADCKKMVLSFGYAMDDINFFADSITHSNDCGAINPHFYPLEINNTWKTMEYECLPNLFFYLDYFSDSPLPLFKLINKISEQITNEVYCDNDITSSNLLACIRSKFTRYNIKFDDNKINERFLLKMYFYTQLMHSHFHNHVSATLSAVSEIAYKTYPAIQQPFIISPLKRNILSETLPHKNYIFDKIYNDFICGLTDIKDNVDTELRFLYDIDNIAWNSSS